MVQVPIKDYVYANARVRAMSSRLMDAQTFNTLLAAPDFNSFLSELDNTEYGPDVEQAMIEGVQTTFVDRAFNRNIVSQLNKIKDFFEGKPHELVCAMMARWDIYNLKTILRGKQALIPNSEILRVLVPMGYLDEVVLGEITAQPDLRASLDLIVAFSRNWPIKYGSAITANLREYQHDHDLAVLELAMDRLHYQEVMEVVKGGDPSSVKVKKIIGMEIDTINHVTMLRLCGTTMERKELSRYYLDGGSIDFKTFTRLSRTHSEDDLIESLPRGDKMRPVLEAGRARLNEKGYASFQDELDIYMMREALKLDDDPLDIGVIIKYMWRKFLEVTNLRIIMRGKSIGLIESQIKKELIVI